MIIIIIIIIVIVIIIIIIIIIIIAITSAKMSLLRVSSHPVRTKTFHKQLL